MNIQNIKSVIEHFPGLVFIKDESSHYIDANKSFLNFSGFNQNDEIIGLTESDLPSYKFAENYIKDDRDTLDFGSLHIVEPILQYNGEEKIILTHKYRSFNDTTSSHCIVGFSTIIELKNLSSLLSLNIGKNLKISTPLFNSLIDEFACKTLTQREGEVLFYLLHGLSCSDIANKLYLSVRTIEDYLHNIKCKLNCDSKNQLIDFAISNGLINVVPEYLLQKIVTKGL